MHPKRPRSIIYEVPASPTSRIRLKRLLIAISELRSVPLLDRERVKTAWRRCGDGVKTHMATARAASSEMAHEWPPCDLFQLTVTVSRKFLWFTQLPGLPGDILQGLGARLCKQGSRGTGANVTLTCMYRRQSGTQRSRSRDPHPGQGRKAQAGVPRRLVMRVFRKRAGHPAAGFRPCSSGPTLASTVRKGCTGPVPPPPVGAAHDPYNPRTQPAFARPGSGT
jgi:hypothetical protein